VILAVSLGNTNLRYLLVDGNAPRARGCVSVRDGALDDAALPSMPPVTEVLLASVHPRLSAAAAAAALARLRAPVLVAGRDFPVPIVNRYPRPEQAGIDRLLGVLAASRIFPGEATAVLDFGTALTVNIGSPQGEFLGGYIGLGAGSAARCLAGAAPRLPSVELRPPASAPGEVPARETARAINDGILWQIAGGVERILEEVRSACAWRLRVIATGGDAELAAPLVRGVDRIEPDLVLLGLLACRPREDGAS
jgi:type III pantothenate kinase